MLAENQFFVYLSQHSAAVLKGRARKLEWLGELPEGELGPIALSQILIKHSTSPIWLFVDSVDEDYRLETQPHVFGNARQEMLERRLRQIYRGQPFCAAWRQGRDVEGRRDDQYLFTALNDSDWLGPWLSAIHSLGFPLAGVSLVSSAAQALLSRLKINEPQILLVSRQPAGLRFSYFQQGLLRFSRLTPGDRGELDCAEEVSRTLLYLTSQRIIPREARCTILLLDLETNHGPTLASLNADPLFDARQITAEQLALALNVPDEFLRAAPGIALLGAQAGAPPILNLAPAKLTRPYRLHRVSRAVNGAAFAFAMGGTVAAGAQWYQANQYKSDVVQFSQDLARSEYLYQQTLKQYPIVTVPPEMLRQVIQVVDQVESGPSTPEAMMTVLSQTLEQHPEIVLRALTWEDNLTSGHGAGSHVDVRAEVEPFDGDYRVAVDQIKSFVATLSAQPEVASVTLVEGPVSSVSDTPLSGSTLDHHSPGIAHFHVSFEHLGGKP
jgi:hypothetical protein